MDHYIFAFFLQVSVGTLLAFTIVAISILILRYVPPDEVPLPSSLQESIDSVSFYYNSQEEDGKCSKDDKSLVDDVEASSMSPLVIKELNHGNVDAFSSAFT